MPYLPKCSNDWMAPLQIYWKYFCFATIHKRFGNKRTRPSTLTQRLPFRIQSINEELEVVCEFHGVEKTSLVAPVLPKTTLVTKSVHHVLYSSRSSSTIVGGRTANTPEMKNAASIKSCGGGKFLLEKTSGRCNKVAAT